MSLLLPALLLAHTTSAPAGETPGQAQVNYVLRHELAPKDDPEADAWWVVEVNVRNLPREGEVGFTLSDWSGWPEDERGYVEVLHADPPLGTSAKESGRFEPELGERRPTKLEFVYRVRLTRMGSEAQRRFGLSPTWSEDHAWGYSWNTLVQVELDGEPLPGKPWIELVAGSLELAGYGTTRTPCDLTYFGLATDFETPGCKVLAVDPDGPAARVGIQVGDVLTGWYPVRATRAEVGDFETEYAFGLGSFQPGVEGSFLGVKRGEVDAKTLLEPVVLGGKGLPTTRSSEGEALDAFFSFEPE